MAELDEAITPDSPEGTKAIVMGVPNAPRSPALGAGMASGSGLQIGAGMGVLLAYAGMIPLQELMVAQGATASPDIASLTIDASDAEAEAFLEALGL